MSSGAISVTIGMLPAMKTTEPYSPSARANASAKPVSSAGSTIGKIDAAEGLPARRAERRRRFLDLARQVLQHRLHRAHDERQADEGQRDEDAERRERDLDAERLEQRADPAVRREERGQRDAGHRRRQRERQVDQRVDERACRESDSAPAPRRRAGRRRR